MNKALLISLVVVVGIVLSALLFGVGLAFGRASLGITGFGPSIMGWNNSRQGYPMMGNGYNQMMGGNGMMGGYGMMGGSRTWNAPNAKALTVDQAKQAVQAYLQRLNNSDLELKEILIFDNNAYARITEKSTGIGAMELLVDPATLSVFPEYGPNMMWNLKYGHMGGANGMMGRNGMMGGLYNNPGTVSATMNVSPEQALKIAQQFLDQQYPGYQTATDADPFYGYYTIEIMKDGKTMGMLSVNGFSGQVFLHTWHGAFIEGSE